MLLRRDVKRRPWKRRDDLCTMAGTFVWEMIAMKKIAVLWACLAARSSSTVPGTPRGHEDELGDITVEIFADKASATAANFLRYVDAGLYDGTVFHRTVTKASRGTGPSPSRSSRAAPCRGKIVPAIALERTGVTGLRHVDGRRLHGPGGPGYRLIELLHLRRRPARAGFRRPPQSDGQGFAAFGKVVAGMESSRKIHESPVDEKEQLTPRSGS